VQVKTFHAGFLIVKLTCRIVSRTATAPFDRLKVFLATRPVESSGPITTEALLHPSRSTKALWSATAQIFKEGGVRGFWIGNGLNIVKIFPVRECFIISPALGSQLSCRSPQSSSYRTSPR
jgi:hypothetical protein